MQALAVALGGSVGANPDGRFVLTIEQVTPTPQLQQFERLHGVVAAALATASSSISGSSAAAADAAADGLAAMQLTEQQPGGSADSPSALAAAAAASMQAAVASAADTSNASCSSCFRVIESHGDQVLSLPPGATCLAASPTACNELWCWGSNVLARCVCAGRTGCATSLPALQARWRQLLMHAPFDACQATDAACTVAAVVHADALQPVSP